MSLIFERLDANLPLNVDIILRLARKLGYAKQYVSNAIPKAERDEIIKLLKLMAKNDKTLFQAKQCYYNSQMLVLKTSGSDIGEKLKYCEGYWIKEGFPITIPHAWCIYDEKYIIDTTLTFDILGKRSKDFSDRAIGTFPSDWEYYGITIEFDEIVKTLGEFSESISFLDDYRIARKRVDALTKELAKKGEL